MCFSYKKKEMLNVVTIYIMSSSSYNLLIDKHFYHLSLHESIILPFVNLSLYESIFLPFVTLWIYCFAICHFMNQLFCHLSLHESIVCHLSICHFMNLLFCHLPLHEAIVSIVTSSKYLCHLLNLLPFIFLHYLITTISLKVKHY